jgi:cysteine desulfurase/selenocysteine lyase
VDYLNAIGMDKIADYEHELTAYLYQQINQIPHLKLYGPQPQADGSGRAALATFTVDGVHAQDLSTLLDQSGIAIRSGHHCTQPLHRLLERQLHGAGQPLFLQHPRRDRRLHRRAEGHHRLFRQRV